MIATFITRIIHPLPNKKVIIVYVFSILEPFNQFSMNSCSKSVSYQFCQTESYTVKSTELRVASNTNIKRGKNNSVYSLWM